MYINSDVDDLAKIMCKGQSCSIETLFESGL